MTIPSTAEEWLCIATERGADADAIIKSGNTSIGSIYLAGYAIECSLKALLQAKNQPFPKHGEQGHNLRNLWRSSGFCLSDISDSKGTKAFFIDQWSTSLRYEKSLESSLSPEELVDGAKQLTGWIQRQIRKKGRKRQ
ncbi:MAG: HEPN domain-containing protein [Leptolyngbyaceae cyanobacterium]